MKNILVFLTQVYKIVATPILVGVLGHGCRFTPTCSEYGGQAIKRFGVIKGLWLGTKRFLRCHPFSKGHFDPVPEHVTNL